MMLLRDERWPVARLIPITSSTGVEAMERHAPSALLAVRQNSLMALSMLVDQAGLNDHGVFLEYELGDNTSVFSQVDAVASDGPSARRLPDEATVETPR